MSQRASFSQGRTILLAVVALVTCVGCDSVTITRPDPATPSGGAAAQDACAKAATSKSPGLRAMAEQQCAQQQQEQPTQQRAAAKQEAESQQLRDESAKREELAHEVDELQRAAPQEQARCKALFDPIGKKLATIEALGQVDTFFVVDIANYQQNLAETRKDLAAMKEEYGRACPARTYPRGAEWIGQSYPIPVFDDEKALASLNLSEKHMAEETACRPSKECMARRRAEHVAADAVPVCDVYAQLQSAQANLARIRGNGARFGVVDLSEVKDAGDLIVTLEQSFRDAKASFKARWKQEFSPALCTK